MGVWASCERIGIDGVLQPVAVKVKRQRCPEVFSMVGIAVVERAVVEQFRLKIDKIRMRASVQPAPPGHHKRV